MLSSRTSGDGSGGSGGVKSVQNAVASIQKKFDSLKQEFQKDADELDRLMAQLQLVETKTTEATCVYL